MKLLAKRIALDEPDAVVFCGDMANELRGAPRARHLRRWVGRWGGLADRVYAIPGNHDYGDDGSLGEWWDAAASRLGPAAQWHDRRCFVLALPALTIYGLDAGPSGRRVDPAQLDWMRERAAAAGTPAPWRVVAIHAPLVPVSIHASRPMAEESRDAVLRFAEDVGAQLLVCGHEHVYARTADLGPTLRAQVVVGGGGADVYPVVRADLRAGESRHHHLVVDATADRLHGVAVDRAGEPLDTWTWRV